jgi:hypothetical protein
MVDSITSYRIANAIEMDKTFSGSYLIVEGTRDEVLYGKFTNPTYCQIQIAQTRDNVIDTIAILNERSFNRALGIIDHDFDFILASVIVMDNLVYTDYHDAEISIIESSAFETVIYSSGSRKKIEAAEKELKKSLRTVFYELAEHIGYLKLANKIDSLGLSFRPRSQDSNPLTYSDFIDVKTLSFKGLAQLVTSVINYSNNRDTKPVSRKDIIDSCLRVKQNAYPHKHLCNGHDLTFIIQLALKSKLGSKSKNELSHKSIELALIYAFDSREFETGLLFHAIKKWESAKGLKILKI